jgi:hypothetical protein
MSLRFYTCRLLGSGFTSSPALNATPVSKLSAGSPMSFA